MTLRIIIYYVVTMAAIWIYNNSLKIVLNQYFSLQTHLFLIANLNWHFQVYLSYIIRNTTKRSIAIYSSLSLSVLA